MRSRLAQVVTGVAILVLLGVAIVGLITAESAPADRADELQERLRCPVCKSVSIAESPSETAQAMRRAVAEQVEAGRSDQQIIDYFRARYGQWVLLDPPRAGSTLPLWLLPFGAAALGGVVLLVLTSRRQRPDPGGELTADQQRRVTRALQQARAAAADEELS